MSGTKAGAQKARTTNVKKYGEDFYKEIGKIGGSRGAKDGAIKGFAAMTPEKRAEAGRKGGTISRRTGKIEPVTRRKWGIF